MTFAGVPPTEKSGVRGPGAECKPAKPGGRRAVSTGPFLSPPAGNDVAIYDL
jgi:hypothetical protein